MTDEAMSPLRRRMIEDKTIAQSHRRPSKATSTPPTIRMTHPRAIGDVPTILTRGSKEFRLGRVGAFKVLEDGFALCGSKIVATLIA